MIAFSAVPGLTFSSLAKAGFIIVVLASLNINIGLLSKMQLFLPILLYD